MSLRVLASSGVIAFLTIGSVSLAGQAQPSESKARAAEAKKSPPRPLPWGDPDLQGVWSYATTTPLERPAALAGKEFYTPEETAARDAASDPLSPEQARPPREGDPGTYNRLWGDAGKTSNLRTSLIIDPPDGRLPPLTPGAQKRIKERAAYLEAHPSDSYRDRPTDDRCINYHGVPPISTGYSNTYQIFQTPGYVAILDEEVHYVRIIPLDGRPKLGDAIRRIDGESRGRWEGKTLVVETTNYSDRSELIPGSPLRFPASPYTRAIERFTRVDAGSIDYQFTIDDPTVYTRPWTAVRPMPRVDGYRIYEYACHEGNHAMTGMLLGARAEEKAAEAAAAAKARQK